MYYFTLKKEIFMRNFEYCAYTYRHRQAIRYLIDKLIKDEDLKKEMMKRADAHDMDKLIMYQITSKEEASKIHKEIAAHHMTNNVPKTYFDKLEAILDYESAGYTKPDKPYNAYDTINRFKAKGLFVDRCNELLKICEEFDLASSYFVTETDQDGVKYLSQFDNVTEEMIQEEIVAYFKNQISALE
jgi:hypothetical protein